MKVFVAILGGLGGRTSSAAILGPLAQRLRAVPGVVVRTGLYFDWETLVEEINALPADVKVMLMGHSLGASVLGRMAAAIRRRVAFIYGFDPAENVFANMTEYANTPIPTNTDFAKAYVGPKGDLGGGEYTAVNPGTTAIENEEIPESHVSAEEAVEDHLEVVRSAELLAA